MKIRLSELRKIVREVLEEDIKNVGSHHQKTVGGTATLKKMHDAPGVLDSLSHIDDPRELAQIIQAIIDSVPITKRAEVMRALNTVIGHERKTHNR